MNKGPAHNETGGESDELRDEYEFDYSKAKPNRFASRVDQGRLVVALDPDVSDVFTTPEAVNKVLRALIEAMPARTDRQSAH
ncbi:MAG: hypothetical protein ACC645_00070 [Pirellulales bacterium]